MPRKGGGRHGPSTRGVHRTQVVRVSDRSLFRRLHGAEELRPGRVPAAGSGVAWYVSPGTNWDGPGIERFARDSGARWIAWTRNTESPVDDMLPLFAEEGAFAVSRQERHRQWRLPLFATAPFRALQAGEASQVLAPLSGTIVVDRAKLLRWAFRNANWRSPHGCCSSGKRPPPDGARTAWGGRSR